MSEESDDSLVGRYAGIVCDLDGVVYRGEGAIEHAVDGLETARSGGTRIAFATNNASRTPHEVAGHLRALGLDASDEDVVNSSQAGAAHLAAHLDAGSHVLAVGGEGVSVALREEGLVPVTPAEAAGSDPRPRLAGVLQGFGRDLGWSDLAEAAFAVQGGALWVGTNGDLTIPVDRGIAPGNGSLLACVREAVDVDPVVVGKPHPPLYERCARLLGTTAETTLAIGDRLDTDIAGAVATGMDSLLVLTGVDGVRSVACADASMRPTYVASDLRALHSGYVAPTVEKGDVTTSVCGDARAEIEGTTVRTAGEGTREERVRAVIAAVWAADVAGELDEKTWERLEAWTAEGGETR